MSLTHFDETGRPAMVDVSAKPATARTAIAEGSVRMSSEALELATAGGGRKGDVCATAELAGIMGAKRTAELIPLCHPLSLSSVRVRIEPDLPSGAMRVRAEVRTTGPTGVEMEALTAVSVACLTIYDMLKAVDKAMTIEGVALISKTGGASRDYERAP